MKKKLMVVSGLVLSFAPGLAFAATCSNIGTIQYMICLVGNILNSLIPVIVVLGLVYFIWGVISYVIAGDEEAKTAGRDRMIYGIIGLAVIVAVWGLVNILVSTFGLNNNTTVTLPTVVIPNQTN